MNTLREVMLDLRTALLIMACFVVVLLGLAYSGAVFAQWDKSTAIRDYLEGTLKENVKAFLIEKTYQPSGVK